MIISSWEFPIIDKQGWYLFGTKEYAYKRYLKTLLYKALIACKDDALITEGVKIAINALGYLLFAELSGSWIFVLSRWLAALLICEPLG